MITSNNREVSTLGCVDVFQPYWRTEFTKDFYDSDEPIFQYNNNNKNVNKEFFLESLLK